MKELNDFRDFLNENKGIAADYADRILGAGEFVDPMELIDFYANNLDDLPEPMEADLFMANLDDIKAMVMQENELHEGTWSLGTLDSMKDVMQGLANIRDKADLAMDPNNKGKGFVDGFKMALNNEAFDARMYRVFGDDSFHDYIAAARREAEVGNFDGAKNALGDALARAAELFDYQYKYENENLEEGEVEEGLGDKLMAKFRNKRAAKKEKERFTKGLDMKDFRGKGPVDIEPEFTAGLEENDAVLDELLNERAPYRNPEIPVDKVLQVLQDFYVRDLTRLKQELERSSGEPTAQPGFKAKLEDMMAKLASFGGSSLEDVEARVKLKEGIDEVSESMGIFKEIDAMIGSIKDQMNPDDAFDSLVSEFEAISGGTKLLHRALKNISLDNNLMEEKDEE